MKTQTFVQQKTSVFSIGTKKKNWMRPEVSVLFEFVLKEFSLFCTRFLTARLHSSFLQRKCLLSVEFQEASLNKITWTESTKYWSRLYSTKFFLLVIHLIVKKIFPRMLCKLLHLFCGAKKFCKDSFTSNSHIVVDRCYCSSMFIANKLALTDQTH